MTTTLLRGARKHVISQTKLMRIVLTVSHDTGGRPSREHAILREAQAGKWNPMVFYRWPKEVFEGPYSSIFAKNTAKDRPPQGAVGRKSSCFQ